MPGTISHCNKITQESRCKGEMVYVSPQFCGHLAHMLFGPVTGQHLAAGRG